MALSESRPDIQRRTYDELFQFGGSLKSVRREHKRILRFFKGARTALDVGCGRGVFMQMLQEIGVKPVGVDLSMESIAYCQRLGLSDVHNDDAVGFLRAHPGEYDAILCSHIVEHMPYEDVLDLLRAAREALTPGGRLVIVTPNARDLRVIGEIFWLDPTHVRPYPLMLLDSMLRLTNFDVVHKSQPLGRPNKVGLFRWPAQLLLLGTWFGHPTSIIVGGRPSATAAAR